jgi:hypothetical protein
MEPSGSDLSASGDWLGSDTRNIRGDLVGRLDRLRDAGDLLAGLHFSAKGGALMKRIDFKSHFWLVRLDVILGWINIVLSIGLLVFMAYLFWK